MLKRITMFFLISIFSINCFAKPITITFWHSMAGKLGTEVNKIADSFNRSQSEYKIVPVYKGNYQETLTSTVAAFRAKQQPDIVQIFDVGTATMMFPHGAIVPVYKVMKDAGIKLKPSRFLPVIAKYYSDTKGRLVAMPFNISTPVMFYNINSFKKAKLDPTTPPKTWPEMKRVSKKLLKAGFSCGFTSSWPSWIQLEAFSAWQNIPFATQKNGFQGLHTRLEYNNPIVTKHIATLAKWQKQRVFVYGGRDDNAQSLFTSEKCPMLMESSGSMADLISDSQFNIGTAPIPYWPNIKGAPQNTIIGGAAIWVMENHSTRAYHGIAEFFVFLAKTKTQIEWQKASGYLPITKLAYIKSEKDGLYAKNPGIETAIKQLTNKKPTPYSRGVRLGTYAQIRQLNVQALEEIWSGQETAKQALNEAVKQGNFLLKRFKENVV